MQIFVAGEGQSAEFIARRLIREGNELVMLEEDGETDIVGRIYNVLAKWILSVCSVCMVAGRLEFYTVLVILTPGVLAAMRRAE
jgi:hypothetical protein